MLTCIDNPFGGILVSQAAFTFIYRFMGNKSLEYPSGILNKANLKSFMSIQGPEDDLRWVPGNERIPDVSGIPEPFALVLQLTKPEELVQAQPGRRVLHRILFVYTYHIPPTSS
jgi:hypothetical protein